MFGTTIEAKVSAFLTLFLRVGAGFLPWFIGFLGLKLSVRVNVDIARCTLLTAVGPSVFREPALAAFSTLEISTGSALALVWGFLFGFHFLHCYAVLSSRLLCIARLEPELLSDSLGRKEGLRSKVRN